MSMERRPFLLLIVTLVINAQQDRHNVFNGGAQENARILPQKCNGIWPLSVTKYDFKVRHP
jgi:hypothetical protein